MKCGSKSASMDSGVWVLENHALEAHLGLPVLSYITCQGFCFAPLLEKIIIVEQLKTEAWNESYPDFV